TNVKRNTKTHTNTHYSYQHKGTYENKHIIHSFTLSPLPLSFSLFHSLIPLSLSPPSLFLPSLPSHPPPSLSLSLSLSLSVFLSHSLSFSLSLSLSLSF